MRQRKWKSRKVLPFTVFAEEGEWTIYLVPEDFYKACIMEMRDIVLKAQSRFPDRPACVWAFFEGWCYAEGLDCKAWEVDVGETTINMLEVGDGTDKKF